MNVKSLWKKKNKRSYHIFSKHINQISDWTIDNIISAINSTKDGVGVKGKMLYMPIRIMVSGQMHGPELPDTIYLLGQETVINRLDGISSM